MRVGPGPPADDMDLADLPITTFFDCNTAST